MQRLEHDIEFADIVKTAVKRRWGQEKLREALKKWERDGDIDYIIIYASSSYLFSIDELAYLYKKYDFSDTESLTRKALELGEIKNYGLMINNLEELSGKKLEVNSLSSKNEDFNSWKKDRTGCLNIFADIPSWVGLKEGETSILLKTVGKGENIGQHFKESIKEMIASMKNKDGDDIDIDEAIDIYLSMKSVEDLSMLGEDEIEIRSRVWGPANPIEDGECSAGGICRMLDCTCYVDDELQDWFIGCCEYCNKKIRDRSHSVRAPMEGGSWEGCYCCMECLKKDTTLNNIALEGMKDTLLRYGIMDRSLI